MAEKLVCIGLILYMAWAIWIAYQESDFSFSSFIASFRSVFGRTSSAPTQTQETSVHFLSTSSAPGYIGLLGMALCLVGMFMPFVDYWYIRASFYGLAKESAAEYLALFICLLLVAGVLYLVCYPIPACVLSFCVLGLFLYSTFGDAELAIDEIISLLEYGFWVMLIGFILMILSPLFDRVNAGIHKLFSQTPPSDIHSPTEQ